MKTTSDADQFRKLAWGVVAYTVAVILWGGYVRASGSGAGCGSHWPTCNGQVLPVSPQYKTWVEFSHRLTSALSLISIGGLGYGAFRIFPKGHPVRKFAALAVFLVFMEAVIGAGLVLLELVDQNQSVRRAVSISLHLVNTLFLMAALTFTADWARDPSQVPKRAQLSGSTRIRLLGLGILFLGIGSSGALTALGDTLFPAHSLSQGFAQDMATGSHFLLRLRIFHPILAAVFVVAAFQLIPTADDYPAARGLQSLSRTLLGLLILNLMLGALNVVWMAPMGIQIVHLLMANLIWITYLLIVSRITQSRSQL